MSTFNWIFIWICYRLLLLLHLTTRLFCQFLKKSEQMEAIHLLLLASSWNVGDDTPQLSPNHSDCFYFPYFSFVSNIFKLSIWIPFWLLAPDSSVIQIVTNLSTESDLFWSFLPWTQFPPSSLKRIQHLSKVAYCHRLKICTLSIVKLHTISNVYRRLPAVIFMSP